MVAAAAEGAEAVNQKQSKKHQAHSVSKFSSITHSITHSAHGRGTERSRPRKEQTNYRELFRKIEYQRYLMLLDSLRHRKILLDARHIFPNTK